MEETHYLNCNSVKCLTAMGQSNFNLQKNKKTFF